MRFFIPGIPAVIYLLSLVFAWPGLVADDFWGTLDEAQRMQFDGHQSPLAAVTIHYLSIGAPISTLFVMKLTVIYFAVYFMLKKIEAIWIQLLALAIVVFPLTLVFAPILRLNFIAAAFVTLSLSIGLFGTSPRSKAASYGALVVASLFSSGFLVGFFFCAALVWSKRHGGWLKPLLGATALVIFITVVHQATEISFDLPSRFSTLYVSKLGDIVGMYEVTGELCVTDRTTRGGAPADIVKRSYQFGVVGYTIWSDDEGFERPPPSQQTYEEVDSCWRKAILKYPLAYVHYKARFMIATLSDGWFGFEGSNFEQPNFFIRIIQEVDRFISENKVNIVFYALGLGTTVVVYVLMVPTPHYPLIVFGWLASLGFLVPQTVFGQAPIARYTFTSTMVLVWLIAFFVVEIGRHRKKLVALSRHRRKVLPFLPVKKVLQTSG
jgi:hypothetical protein